MRVLIDATSIPADLGGVGRYVDALVPELVAAGVEVTVVVQPRDKEHFASRSSADLVVAPTFVARRAARMLWEQVGLARTARRVGADVVHSPHYTMPALLPFPRAVTLHDATFFSTPELHLRTKAAFFRRATRRAVRHADSLIVPSQATMDEVLRYTSSSSSDAGRFRVAYHGVDTERFVPTSRAEQDRVRATLGISEARYVGFLGTLEPRKNVPALIEGWVGAVRDLVDPPALVLAGGPGWDDRIDAAIARVPSGLTVRRTGYLPLSDLPGFLSGATVLAYPSLGEGFGLPVLEAMSCGATVLTTRELSLPEVGGDAVAYCGTDARSIQEELTRLLADDRARSDLAARAIVRAGEFSWAAAASAHIDAYERAIAHHATKSSRG
ncbi:glycosyltransferase family 1 protein [Sanguibacter sp. 25GB23B1]|uniref:glycosyltransferase family 4 protein n=1 Tax=unclassified Sanguibacter TaxID=2645534 RepID=UPI0032B00873